MKTNDKGFNTKLIHAGAFDDEFGSATVPIYNHQPSNSKMPGMEQTASREKQTDIFIPELGILPSGHLNGV